VFDALWLNWADDINSLVVEQPNWRRSAVAARTAQVFLRSLMVFVFLVGL
jgi:hypothetical protein